MNKLTLYKITHITTYLTVLHGLIYFIIKYFFKVETEYGLRPHLLQSYTQAAHILLSPLLIFTFGLLLKEHILKMYRTAKRKRKTGIILFVTMIIMIFSGYLVQVVYDIEYKSITAWLHIITSFIFTLAYIIHHKLK